MDRIDQAQLQKRSRELDAREEFIDEKSRILKDAPVTLKVYKAHIEASEKSLSQLQQKIAEETYKLDQLHTEADYVVKRNSERSERTKKELTQLTDRVKAANTELIVAQLKVKDVEAQLSDREEYLKNQEKIIAKVVEQGNDQLLDINSQIIYQRSVNSDLERQNVALKAKLDEETAQFELKKQDYTVELATLEGQVHKLEREVTDLVERITNKSEEYKRIDKDISKRLSELKRTEESMTAKREAMVLERQELSRDQQRWNSNKAQYEI